MPEWPNFMKIKENDFNAKLKSEKNYNRRKGARKLPPLSNNQTVRVRLPHQKEWGTPEDLIGRRGNTSYLIRNRKHLQAMPDNIVTGTTEAPREDSVESGGDAKPDVPSATSHNVPNKNDIVMVANKHDVVENQVKTRYGRIVKPVIRYHSS